MNDTNDTTGWPRAPLQYAGRFGLEFALSALEAIWTVLDAQGPGIEDTRDLPFTGIAIDLDMRSGRVEPTITLTPGWFRALFGGSRVDVQEHDDDPEWLTLDASDLGLRWRTTARRDALPLDAADGARATLREHDPDAWAAAVAAERLILDADSAGGILRPLPSPPAPLRLLSALSAPETAPPSADGSTPAQEPTDAPGAPESHGGAFLD